MWSTDTLSGTHVGNFPALESPGPRRRGICLMRASEARKASYFLASFLTSFLFLLSFFKSSTDMYWGAERVVSGGFGSETGTTTNLELNQLGPVNVESIGENADGHARTGNVGEPERRRQRLAWFDHPIHLLRLCAALPGTQPLDSLRPTPLLGQRAGPSMPSSLPISNCVV
jgi:hypothetical protein